jgi:hypothetical protein
MINCRSRDFCLYCVGLLYRPVGDGRQEIEEGERDEAAKSTDSLARTAWGSTSGRISRGSACRVEGADLRVAP